MATLDNSFPSSCKSVERSLKQPSGFKPCNKDVFVQIVCWWKTEEHPRPLFHFLGKKFFKGFLSGALRHPWNPTGRLISQDIGPFKCWACMTYLFLEIPVPNLLVNLTESRILDHNSPPTPTTPPGILTWRWKHTKVFSACNGWFFCWLGNFDRKRDV